jgi:hypothetical protein
MGKSELWHFEKGTAMDAEDLSYLASATFDLIVKIDTPTSRQANHAIISHKLYNILQRTWVSCLRMCVQVMPQIN